MDEKPNIHRTRPGDPETTVGLMCECQKCGMIAKHTMYCDFYTLAKDESHKLYCEPCMMRIVRDTYNVEEVIDVVMEPGSEPIKPGDRLEIDDEEEEDDPADWWKK